MQTWEKLVKNALLGTERMALQVDILPDVIKNALHKETSSDAETLFLKAAALTMVYKKAGNIAPIVPAAVPIIAPAEALPYCSPLASATWRKIQLVAPKNVFLLELWLDKLIDNQWIVSPEIIVALLEIGASKKGIPLREKISAVVGARGTWLVQFNEKWNYILPTNDVTIFHEGKAAERLAALRRIRRLTPNMARILLSETWAKESMKDRKAFVEVFSIQFSEEDKPLVEQWKKEAQFHEYEPLLSIFQANETIEANLMSHFDLLHKADWGNLPLYFAWSKDFSEFMLRQVYESFQYVHFTRGAALLPWVAHLHHEVKLEHIPRIEDRHEQKFQWAEYCSKNVAKAIDLRRMIAAF
jgi:hypothetical protein